MSVNLMAGMLQGLDPQTQALVQAISSQRPREREVTVKTNQMPASIEANNLQRHQEYTDDVRNDLTGLAPGLGRAAPIAGVLKAFAKARYDAGAEATQEELSNRVRDSLAAEQAQAQAAAQAEYERKKADERAKYEREQAAALEQWQRERGASREDADIEYQREREMAGYKAELDAENQPGYDFDQESKLRKEFGDTTKAFSGINDSFGRVKASLEKPSAAGDLALIFNYMKMLDPGSTVREGEFAQAAASGGYGERLKAAGQSILSGKRLSDSQRADFGQRAGMLYKEALAAYDQRASQYTDLASQYNARPEAVVRDRALYRDYELPEVGGAPPEGFTLMEDANGVRAYVGPNGEIREIE